MYNKNYYYLDIATDDGHSSLRIEIIYLYMIYTCSNTVHEQLVGNGLLCSGDHSEFVSSAVEVQLNKNDRSLTVLGGVAIERLRLW